jgi:dTDP-4-amino-4,6-dideoxygalactose transaminase
VGLGMKVNMADVNAAIGLAQMKKYRELLLERKRIFSQYNDAFRELEWALVPPFLSNGKETSYHLYALRIKDINELQRDAIIEEIAKTGVAVNVHFIPLPMLTFFKELGYNVNDFPQAYFNYSCEISLPIYPQLTFEQVNYVINVVKSAYHKVIVVL